ncbi:MAG: LptF/LptG family permease [Aquificaceae bacterium]
MLNRYLLSHYLKTFSVIFLVIIGILYIYLMGEFFLVFKEKDWHILLSYTLNLLPVVFFYVSPFVAGLAVVVSFRRFIQRKIDLLSQSFGISPLRFSLIILLFSFIVSLINLFGSSNLYPKSQRDLYRIEKEHKKAKELEKGIVRNLWLVEENKGVKAFYHFDFVDVSSGILKGFYRLKVVEGSIEELITAERGKWNDDVIELKEAKIKDLLKGEEAIKDINLKYIHLSRIEPLAEKPEHLAMKELLLLSIVGKEIGINQRYYLYEVVKRLLSSSLTFFLSLVVLWAYLKWRRSGFAFLSLVTVFFLHWLLLNLVRSLVENTGISFNLLLFIYLPIPVLSLKALYDLGKGFRV